MHSRKIPVVSLYAQLHENSDHSSNAILENEIKGIHVDHVVVANKKAVVDSTSDGYKTIYLFVKGRGVVIAENTSYEIVPETIFLPNAVESISIESTGNHALQFLRISCKLSAQDKLDLQELPTEHVQNVYCANSLIVHLTAKQ